MVVEYIPLVLGILVLLLGVAIMWDAWGPQAVGGIRERRRRTRAALDLKGELLAGVGIVLLGVALIGHDWRLETPVILAGAIFLLIGALRNRKYFRELFLFRGRARRNTEPEPKKTGRMRIR
ncbi:MAG: hypothetical protein ABI026_04960 [Gemmatimonadaceae bacterium]